MEFDEQPNSLKYANSPGLNIISSALSDVGIRITDDETMSTYFDVQLENPTGKVTRDFMAGWWSLSTRYPALAPSLHNQLLSDITRCKKVYDRIRPGKPSPKPFRMTVSIDPDQFSESDEMVPPKVIGGKIWSLNPEYVDIQNKWMDAGFPLLNPCIALGWPGVQRKVISSRDDINDCDTLLLLTTVDYDLDRQNSYDESFTYAATVSKRCLSQFGSKLQSTALAGLLGLDLQVYMRRLQETWIVNGTPAGNLGPDDISPSEWVCTMIGDSGVFSACGYEDQKYYPKTRPGIFTAVALANMHDIVYDLACNNRISSGLYAAGADVSKFNLHAAFASAMIDGVAHRNLKLNPTDVPFFGDNAVLLTAVWVLFIERYRIWERFIKYVRILRRSKAPEAQNLLNMAKAQTVLDGIDINNVEEGWKKATTKTSVADLKPRTDSTVAYPIVSAAPEMANLPGLPQPNLCPHCKVKFEDALSTSENEVFYAIPGLPTSVTTCHGVTRAAAIRRVALHATGDDYCNLCACKIGRWADIAGYMVCGALMEIESTTSGPEWLLQCHAIWSVSLNPLSVVTVLSGFDLLCDVRCEDGAMGRRDVLEVWEAQKKDSSFRHGN